MNDRLDDDRKWQKTATFLVGYKVSAIRLCRKYHSSKDLFRNLHKNMHPALSKPASNKCVQFLTHMNVRVAFHPTREKSLRSLSQDQHLGPVSTSKTFSVRCNQTFLQNQDTGMLAVLRLGLFIPLMAYLIQTATERLRILTVLVYLEQKKKKILTTLKCVLYLPTNSWAQI